MLLNLDTSACQYIHSHLLLIILKTPDGMTFAESDWATNPLSSGRMLHGIPLPDALRSRQVVKTAMLKDSRDGYRKWGIQSTRTVSDSLLILMRLTFLSNGKRRRRFSKCP